MTTIGFIGLGTMGRDMAINLVRAGHALSAYDIRTEAIADLAAHGATPADSVADAVRDADIVITMLPDTPQVEEVILGSGGILTHPPRGRLLIDMSTISPQATRRFSAALARVGVDLLDAPVSGGPIGAR